MAESNAYNSILQYYTQKQVDNDLLIRERRKEIRDGRMVIIRNASVYSTLGQQIR